MDTINEIPDSELLSNMESYNIKQLNNSNLSKNIMIFIGLILVPMVIYLYHKKNPIKPIEIIETPITIYEENIPQNLNNNIEKILSTQGIGEKNLNILSMLTYLLDDLLFLSLFHFDNISPITYKEYLEIQYFSKYYNETILNFNPSPLKFSSNNLTENNFIDGCKREFKNLKEIKYHENELINQYIQCKINNQIYCLPINHLYLIENIQQNQSKLSNYIIQPDEFTPKPIIIFNGEKHQFIINLLDSVRINQKDYENNMTNILTDDFLKKIKIHLSKIKINYGKKSTEKSLINQQKNIIDVNSDQYILSLINRCIESINTVDENETEENTQINIQENICTISKTIINKIIYQKLFNPNEYINIKSFKKSLNTILNLKNERLSINCTVVFLLTQQLIDILSSYENFQEKQKTSPNNNLKIFIDQINEHILYN